MVTLSQLWLPIVLSAIAVFILSSLIHMVFKWHNADYRPLSNEDEVRAAIRRAQAGPGQYALPYCPGMKEMQAADAQRKFAEGPVALLVLRQNGPPAMGPALGLWFLYVLVVGLFAAYLASRMLGAGTPPAGVFRATATIALLTYAGGSIQSGIWMGKPWASVAKDLLDAAIYAAATGAVFAAMYPH